MQLQNHRMKVTFTWNARIKDYAIEALDYVNASMVILAEHARRQRAQITAMEKGYAQRLPKWPG
jgi:hypothetical protein